MCYKSSSTFQTLPLRMSSEINVAQDVKDLIEQIITRNKLDLNAEVAYHSGSEPGEGFIAKTVAVDVKTEKESLHLFVKCPPEVKTIIHSPDFNQLLFNEVYFYKDVYPTFQKFLQDRALNEEEFVKVPRCHATNNHDIVAMENLRMKGYELFDKSKVMDDLHITLTLKAFARFHAVSFAMEDQEKEKYETLTENMNDLFSMTIEDDSKFRKSIENNVNAFLANLDPVKDACFLEKCENLAEKLVSCFRSAGKNLDEHSTITKGDCWCNNMMFLYEDQDRAIPIDIMLIDWQLVRQASPVFDIAYFFYTIADKESLDKFDDYVKVYHDELAKLLRQLGSNPDLLYPYDVLKEEWKKYCKSGVCLAFCIIRMMLLTKEELGKILQSKDKDDITQKYEKEDEYMEKMRNIMEHLINNDFL